LEIGLEAGLWHHDEKFELILSISHDFVGAKLNSDGLIYVVEEISSSINGCF
jgi:hypothetical protein